MARRRPTFIWFLSRAMSCPGRPFAAQYRIASAPNVVSRLWGSSSLLPFDFDSFLRSGSCTNPEMAASCHGSTPCMMCDRTTL